MESVLGQPRASGVLLHPTSLPETGGRGDLGAPARRFVEWLAAHDQTVWQMLPVGPTGFGGSPYDSPSAMAGNTRWISPSGLLELGLLMRSDLPDLVTPLNQPELLALAWDRYRRL
ncbi:MAG: 4-alpha-glucanotransferase, partial [Thermoanaerobaculia bacterium]|nr:4-alpha-glucanotransferase [Thermoanaerobaculia bacterium]